MPIVFFAGRAATTCDSLAPLIRAAGWRSEAVPSAEGFPSRPGPGVPCCLVLEATSHGDLALELQKQLAWRTDLPIIFVSGNGDVAVAVQAMKAGAVEFLMQPIDDGLMLGAIGQALDRSRAALVRESEMQALRTCYESLTPREREVMALVVSGLLNKQVGGELGISEITVKAHRGQVMRKMKADSLPDLVRMAPRLDVRLAAIH